MTEAVLQSDTLTVRINLDQGAEITHIVPTGGENILFFGDWKSPLPAGTSQTYGSGHLDWLSAYRGGWQEMFPNAGNPGTVLGTPMPFHGEVSRTRWTAEWHEPEREVTVSSGTRLPLVIHRRMRLDPKRPVLFLDETIENESDLTVPYIWGHHPAFGPPLAAPGARIDLPAGKLVTDEHVSGDVTDLAAGSTHTWGNVTDKSGNAIDLSTIPAAPMLRLAYIHELSDGWAAIRNPANGLGAGLVWDKAAFPHLWFWQEIGASAGMPFYGRAAITALEPNSQVPSHGLEEAIAAGTARHLPPRGKATARIALSIFKATDKPVTRIDADGNVHT